MKLIRVEDLRDSVIGLRPVYFEGGNSTEIFVDSAEVFLDKRIISSVMRALARSYAMDLTAQRKLLKERLSRKAVLPFYLDEKRVFVPLKMRTGLTPRDSIYGYLDVLYMDEITALEKKTCEVKLVNNVVLTVLSSRNTIVQSEHLGREVLALLRDGQDDSSDETRIIESVRSVLRTLGDMARQIARIEEKL